LLGLFFDPEDTGDILFLNVNWLSTDYTALYPGRQNSSIIVYSEKEKKNLTY
jgi:hypothetical protein